MEGQNLLKKDRLIITEPDKYNNIEIRNISFDTGEGLAGFDGNMIVGDSEDSKDIFFLSIRPLDESQVNAVCDKIEEIYQDEKKPINLSIYDSINGIYNLNNNS
ncbi:MAG TPA: hypothetical protein GX498_08945 [Clostridiales bacterium]|nr:hypothetical protein [Clostridiales bacterium]